MSFFRNTILVIGIVCCASCQSKWKPYRPLVFNDGSLGCTLCEDMELYTNAHRCRIKQVFDHYGVPWNEDGAEILIPSDLDDEYIWNLTQKADGESPAWSGTTYDSTGAVVKHDTLIFRCGDVP